jgi:hypothetical protein
MIIYVIHLSEFVVSEIKMGPIIIIIALTGKLNYSKFNIK